jgi:antitoxin (DNA-binding transcriptional repressor) of toxin-antitoxin stability system
MIFRRPIALGESFIIAKAGKPMIKVIAPDAPESAQKGASGF